MLTQLFSGFAFGLMLQIAVGPVCMAVLQQALDRGWLAAWAMVWGAVLVDSFYITLAALGMAALLQAPGLQLALSVAGVLALIYFAWRIWRAPVSSAAVKIDRAGLLGSLGYGIAISLTSPLTILFWGGVFGKQILQGGFRSPAALAAFGAGCVASTLVFLTLTATLASQVRRLLTATVRCWANRATALVLLGFALHMAWGIVR